MVMKVYRRRGWARRAAAKLKWHTTEECRGGFIVRPMTEKEKAVAMELRSLGDVAMAHFIPAIKALLLEPSPIFNLIRRSR